MGLKWGHHITMAVDTLHWARHLIYDECESTPKFNSPINSIFFWIGQNRGNTYNIGLDFRQLLIPDSKVHGANMGPTWVLSAPAGPHVGPMNIAIRDVNIDTYTVAELSAFHFSTACNPWRQGLFSLCWGKNICSHHLHDWWSTYPYSLCFAGTATIMRLPQWWLFDLGNYKT